MIFRFSLQSLHTSLYKKIRIVVDKIYSKKNYQILMVPPRHQILMVPPRQDKSKYFTQVYMHVIRTLITKHLPL
jgi:hypothetical protein